MTRQLAGPGTMSLARRIDSRRDFLKTIGMAMTVLGLPGCARLGWAGRRDRAVPPYVTERANIVLSNLLRHCAIVNGRWQNEMDPGCAEVFSTLFLYPAGLRRRRQDLVKIAETVVQAERTVLRAVMFRAVTGQQPPDPAVISGFPSLLVSGTVGKQSADLAQLSLAVDQLLRRRAHEGFGPVQNAGIAAVVAELYRLDPDSLGARIEEARYCANRAFEQGYPTLAAMGWAAIAKATRNAGDIERAKGLAGSNRPRFTESPYGKRFTGPYHDVLSLHLALTHAFADLAELEPRADWRAQAVQLVKYVFSDAYFDGRFLMHHVENGRSEKFCSGCNFFALHLADRLYEKKLVLGPIPEPRIVDAELEILSANYGAEDKWVDVEKQLTRIIAGNRLCVRVSNDIAGDPIPGVVKTLKIECRIGDQTFVDTVRKGQLLLIP